MTQAGKVVRAVNWRYAAGELLLIVAGILIALAISDWNDRRIERQEELGLLREIRSAIQLDQASLSAKLFEIQQAEKKIQELQALAADPRPYDPSMDQLFGAVYATRLIPLNTSPYDTLRSIGLQRITNDSLRLAIAQLYDTQYENLVSNHEVDGQTILMLLRPYFLEHFKDLSFARSATPLDYERVIRDQYFINLVDYRLAILRSNQLTNYPKTIDAMNVLLNLLDKEMD